MGDWRCYGSFEDGKASLAKSVVRPVSLTRYSITQSEKEVSPYLCTPVAIGGLSNGICWPPFDLASVVDAEINVVVEDVIADGV